jgi:threonine dehydrogenase-like Zn-dependent dehydrogenase
MKRVAKPEGAYNIVIEEVDVPKLTDTGVLIRAERTLISRGSEVWRRYVRTEAIEPRRMGYSLAGTVVEVGAAVEGFSPGDRVAATAPHAEYVAVDTADSGLRPAAVPVPERLSSEAATFWPLAVSSVLWVWEADLKDGDTIVIVGQGLVGSLVAQVALANGHGRVIVVDALPMRCELARELGAHDVVDASAEDPVQAVMRLTDGKGAEVVVEAVGGRAGVGAFNQAQDMVAEQGLLQVIGLYEGEPLSLDSSKIQRRRLVGGYLDRGRRAEGSARALKLLASGTIHAERMITHRFPFSDAAVAFDLLYNRLGEAMAVLLVWD